MLACAGFRGQRWKLTPHRNNLHHRVGCRTRWGYAFMAMDLAMDRRGNAFVLDVNSGPSYYHFDMPVRPCKSKLTSITFFQQFRASYTYYFCLSSHTKVL